MLRSPGSPRRELSLGLVRTCCGVGDRLDAGDMEISRPGLGLESW